MKHLVFCFLLIVGMTAGAQTPDVTATGNCNGVAKGINITVVVKCDPSVSKAQALVIAREYAQILDTIRRNHLSYAVVISKLDSIQKGVDELQAAAKARRLSESQIQTLKRLIESNPTSQVPISYLMNDEESTAFARDFQAALNTPDPDMRPGLMLVPGIGLHFYVSERFVTRVSDTQVRVLGDPPECQTLRAFLDGENIPYVNEISLEAPSVENPPCALTVGSKPVSTKR